MVGSPAQLDRLIAEVGVKSRTLTFRRLVEPKESSRQSSEGIIMSEQESEPGGPQYGGDRGGRSGGIDGGQGGAERESGEEHHSEQGGQSGDVGGRGPTERDGEPTTEPATNDDSDASRIKGAERAQDKQREMQASGEEFPG